MKYAVYIRRTFIQLVAEVDSFCPEAAVRRALLSKPTAGQIEDNVYIKARIGDQEQEDPEIIVEEVKE